MRWFAFLLVLVVGCGPKVKKEATIPSSVIPLTGTGLVIFQSQSHTTLRYDDNRVVEYNLCPDTSIIAYLNMVVTIQFEQKSAQNEDGSSSPCYVEVGSIEHPEKEKELPIHSMEP